MRCSKGNLRLWIIKSVTKSREQQISVGNPKVFLLVSASELRSKKSLENYQSVGWRLRKLSRQAKLSNIYSWNSCVMEKPTRRPKVHFLLISIQLSVLGHSGRMRGEVSRQKRNFSLLSCSWKHFWCRRAEFSFISVLRLIMDMDERNLPDILATQDGDIVGWNKK